MKIDKKLIKELVENLKEFSLTELEYQDGQTKIKVSKASKSIDAVKGINFNLKKGQTLAIIGESGSGKSVTALVIMGILSCPPGRIKSGEIFLNNEDILKKLVLQH